MLFSARMRVAVGEQERPAVSGARGGHGVDSIATTSVEGQMVQPCTGALIPPGCMADDFSMTR